MFIHITYFSHADNCLINWVHSTYSIGVLECVIQKNESWFNIQILLIYNYYFTINMSMKFGIYKLVIIINNHHVLIYRCIFMFNVGI